MKIPNNHWSNLSALSTTKTPSINRIINIMPQELQIKATIAAIENKTDKNANSYFRISCQG
jgi:hypothetical protein